MTMSQNPLPSSSSDINYQSRGLVDADAEHLKILSICWYVSAALTAFGGFFPLIYVALGFAAMSGSMGPGGPPQAVGMIFVIFGAIFSVLIWTIALLSFLTGRSLARRKRLIFCYISAAISCISFPIGTTLGVFTFIVLARPSVKNLFQ